MKKLRWLIFTLLSLGLSPLVLAATLPTDVKYDTATVNEAGLTFNNTYPIPLNSYGINRLAFTSIASSVTFANDTFTDGRASTGVITVISTTGLTAVQATDTLNVLALAAVGSDAAITVNGIPLYVNVHWWFDATYTTATAISIKQAVNQYVGGVIASTGASTVVITAAQYGSFGNAMTLVSNTSTITVNSANFTGGKDSATLSINGVFIPFTPVATASMTALSIQNGINSTTALSAIIVATVPAGSSIVSTTATAVGVNAYAMTSSTQSSLTIGGTVVTTAGASVGAMSGGTDSSYTINTSTIIIASHGFTRGLPVLYTTGTIAIGGLTWGTTYFVIPITPNSIELASSLANALASIPVVLTSSSTTITVHTFTLAPLAIAGVPSWKFEVSNDGTNYFPYNATSANVTVSSVSYTSFIATGTVQNQDLGPINYGFIRANVVAPTAGAINLKININGKE